MTGATSGIGRGTAQVMAEEGCEICVVGRSIERGAGTVDAIHAKDGRATFLECDVSDHAQVARMVERAVRVMGTLDTLVNCAGIGIYRDVVEFPVEDLDRVLATNLRGTMLVTKHAIPHIEAAGGGAIVNVSSVHSLEAAPSDAAYATTKAGIDAFTRACAIDFAPLVRANSVQPGWIESTLTARLFDELAPDGKDGDVTRAAIASEQPARRIGTPEDVGRVVAFLASDEAAFVTGASLAVDGGLTALLERWTPEKVRRIAEATRTAKAARAPPGAVN